MKQSKRHPLIESVVHRDQHRTLMSTTIPFHLENP
jgi:hypothetical protein